MVQLMDDMNENWLVSFNYKNENIKIVNFFGSVELALKFLNIY